MLVATVKLWVSLVIVVQFRRWYIISPAPSFDLFLAVLIGRLSLVEALESTVVALVESPSLLTRDVGYTHLIGDVVVSVDRSGQQRRVSNIEVETLLLQNFACLLGLFSTELCQVDVAPAGEAVLKVPLALSVTNEYNLVSMSTAREH